MTNTYLRYALTINPSAYKKWSQNDIIFLLERDEIHYAKIPKNYHSCSQELQRDILTCIYREICDYVYEVGELIFEETELKNLHFHTWFVCKNGKNVNEMLAYINALNETFSSGLQYKACYVKPIHDLEGWQKYCRKWCWLQHVKQTYKFEDGEDLMD